MGSFAKKFLMVSEIEVVVIFGVYSRLAGYHNERDVDELKIEIPSLASPSDIGEFFQAVGDDNVRKHPELAAFGRPSVNYFFLRDAENKMCGGVCVSFTYDVVWIDTIWVDPGFRRQGHGARLYRAVEDLAYLKKKRRAVLSSFDFQNAGDFWLSLGFAKFGEVPGERPGDRLQYYAKEIKSEDRGK